MNLADAFAYGSTLLLLIGYVQLGNKKLSGWLIQIFGDLGWITAGALMGITSVWATQILFTLLHVRGLIKWWRDSAAARGPF